VSNVMPCAICFESLTATDVIELPCGHVFHILCIIKLVQSRNRRCPLCRARITSNVYQLQEIANACKHGIIMEH
jgi:hypothetical protein